MRFQFGLRFALLEVMLEKFTAFQIAKKCYWKCKTLKLPKFLQDQILRASSSIGLNLAEGSGK
jgi:four helix bundle protein